jgi:hypothetical protein
LKAIKVFLYSITNFFHYEYSEGQSIACPVIGNQEVSSLFLLCIRYHGIEKSSMLLRTAEAAKP